MVRINTQKQNQNTRTNPKKLVFLFINMFYLSLLQINTYFMTRISLYVSETIVNQVKEIAEKEKRSVSQMIEILLERAIKERNRKSKKQQTNDK